MSAKIEAGAGITGSRFTLFWRIVPGRPALMRIENLEQDPHLRNQIVIVGVEA